MKCSAAAAAAAAAAAVISVNIEPANQYSDW